MGCVSEFLPEALGVLNIRYDLMPPKLYWVGYDRKCYRLNPSKNNATPNSTY